MNFEKRIESNLEEVKFFATGQLPWCRKCPDSSGLFSWDPCNSCGSNLGGDRYSAHGTIEGEVMHFSICTDCLFYHLYGELPEEHDL